jgi:hypothetical protein
MMPCAACMCVSALHIKYKNTVLQYHPKSFVVYLLLSRWQTRRHRLWAQSHTKLRHHHHVCQCHAVTIFVCLLADSCTYCPPARVRREACSTWMVTCAEVHVPRHSHRGVLSRENPIQNAAQFFWDVAARRRSGEAIQIREFAGASAHNRGLMCFCKCPHFSAVLLKFSGQSLVSGTMPWPSSCAQVCACNVCMYAHVCGVFM